MKIIIDVNDSSLADMYKGECSSDLYNYFNTDSRFAEVLVAEFSDYIPYESKITFEGFDKFKKTLKELIKKEVIDAIDEELNNW